MKLKVSAVQVMRLHIPYGLLLIFIDGFIQLKTLVSWFVVS